MYTHKVEKKENRLDREAALQSQWKEEVKEKEATQKELKRKLLNENASDDKDDDGEYQPIFQLKKRSQLVTIQLPRNPWRDPEVTAMLDRTKITSNQAVGFFSSIVRSGKIERESMDLDEFTLSQASVHRIRDKNRGVLAELARKEFEEQKPKHACLHWDGKMMDTCLG